MKKHSPCPEWTTKLALRWNDFSPSEWRTFEAHMKECTGCSARRAEYGVLIAELQMLPSPTQQATPGPLTYMPHESGEEPLEVYDCFTHPGILDAEIYFKQASALFSSAQYYEALPLCNYALKLDPENEEIWALKGKILAAQWSYKEALAACDQALKLKSDEVAFLSMQASLLYTLKRYEEALRATKKLLKRDPHNLEGWHIKAWALQKLKRYPEAIKACDSALTLNSDIGAIWKVKCRSLLALRKYKEALEACNRALEKRVGDVELWHIRASEPFLLEREEEKGIQDDLLQLDPNYVVDTGSIERWVDRVRLLSLANPQRYEKALEACNRALWLDPQRKTVWEIKGRVLIALGLFNQALAVFEHDITLEPDDAEEWRFLGCVFNRLCLYDNARIAFNRAEELDPYREHVWGQTTSSLLPI